MVKTGTSSSGAGKTGTSSSGMPQAEFLLPEDAKKLFEAAREKVREHARERGVHLTKCLHDMWKNFYRLPDYQECGLHMNYQTLAMAAESFWEDMLRLKTYHDLEYGDRHKVAAHLFKWISRMRPIKPVNDSAGQQSIPHLEANARFALACAQAFLETEDFKKTENQYVLYASMYRDIHAREWAMIFYLLEQLHPPKKAA